MTERPTNLLYVTRRFPGITFVLREVLEIARDEGVNLRIVTDDVGDGVTSGLRTATGETFGAPLPADVRQRILSIPTGRRTLFVCNLWTFLRRPLTYVRLAYALYRTKKHRGLIKALKYLSDFFRGAMLYHQVWRASIDRVHGDFGSWPTTLAMVIARFLGVPFTFTAHAQDVFREQPLLKAKIAAAEAVVTCTGFNRNHLIGLVGPADRGKIFAIHHGLDFETLAFERKSHNDVPVILAVGRMDPFKGFTYLVDALDFVRRRGAPFKAHIIGSGLEFESVRARIHEKNLAAEIDLPGALPFAEVKKHFERADVFVAPSILTNEAGRFDGLPNVLIEAMASRTPIVATRISGIPEAVKDGENGLLVAEKDPESMAEAILKLLSDRELRESMGEAGYRIARDAFDLRTNVGRLKRVMLGRP